MSSSQTKSKANKRQLEKSIQQNQTNPKSKRTKVQQDNQALQPAADHGGAIISEERAKEIEEGIRYMIGTIAKDQAGGDIDDEEEIEHRPIDDIHREIAEMKSVVQEIRATNSDQYNEIINRLDKMISSQLSTATVAVEKIKVVLFVRATVAKESVIRVVKVKDLIVSIAEIKEALDNTDTDDVLSQPFRWWDENSTILPNMYVDCNKFEVIEVFNLKML
jgi:hypothetical protein